MGFLGGPVVKNTPASARDTGSTPSLGRSHSRVHSLLSTCALEHVLFTTEATVMRSWHTTAKIVPVYHN